MTLLNAGLLTAGLLSAAIPILIHLLFRRRRPPIDWAAMDILRAALRRQERRLRLEQWLLLAARCLLFGVAGLALARPVLEGTGLLAPSGGRVVTIVLDDGVVTQARDGATDAFDGSAGTAFHRLKRETAELIRGLPTGDSVGVLLAARSDSAQARALVMPPSSDRDAVARAVEALEPTQAATDFSSALRAVADAIGRTPDAEHLVVLASDFRAGSLDLSMPSPSAIVGESATASGGRSPTIIAFRPATEDRADVAITGVEAQRSVDDDSISVAVRLERRGAGNPAATVRVSLTADGTTPVQPKSVRFDPGQASARVEFAMRPSSDATRTGSGAIEARIEGDAMPANDAHFAIFDARSATRIGIVARRSFGSGAELDRVPAARWLARAISPVPQPGIDVVEIEPAAVDARALRDFDAILLPRPESLDAPAWPELRRFVDRGGLLIAFASGDTASQRWTDRFVSTFDLPWQIAAEAPPLEPPLTFAAEQPQRGNSQALFAAIDAELPELLRPIEVRKRLETRQFAPSDVVLALSDGTPFLLIGAPSSALVRGEADASSAARGVSRGLVGLVTAAPELAWTNLPVKPFVVPFSQEMVRRGLARIGGEARSLVGDRPIVMVREAAELIGPDGRRAALDRDGIAATALDRAGAWNAVDQSGRVIGGVPVNIDDGATRLLPQSQDAIATWLSPISPNGQVRFGAPTELLGALTPSSDSVGVAVWLLAALVALAVLETMLARTFSHAANTSGGRADGGITATALRANEERTPARALSIGGRA
jgi:hypothetical protein